MEDRCNVATGMHYIALALNNTFGSGRSAKAAKSLSNVELKELEKHGLKSIPNPYVFISPAYLHVTPCGSIGQITRGIRRRLSQLVSRQTT
jgi:hypothetical protein